MKVKRAIPIRTNVSSKGPTEILPSLGFFILIVFIRALVYVGEHNGRDEHDILRTLVHGIRVDLLSSVLTEIEAGISKVILL